MYLSHSCQRAAIETHAAMPYNAESKSSGCTVFTAAPAPILTLGWTRRRVIDNSRGGRSAQHDKEQSANEASERPLERIMPIAPLTLAYLSSTSPNPP